MRWSRPLSIRHKITLLIVVVTSLVLVVVGAAFFAYEYVRFERAAIANLSTIAGVLGENLAPSLAFDDREAAGRVLAGLVYRPNILQAALYRKDGQIYATHVQPGVQSPPLPATSPAVGLQRDGDNLILVEALFLGGDQEGTLLILASMRERRQRLLNYAEIVGACTLAALVVAWLLGARLQHLITRPILALTNVASEVGRSQDYSLRAPRQSADEIGTLVDGFNHMLARIQAGGEALRTSEERLAFALRGASDGLWDWNLATNEVYYSPRWIEMLGYGQHELPATLGTWAKLVHPDDRETALRAAGAYQAGLSKRFEVEFRMRHKDGHWIDILSRAILVRDATHRPIRLVGTHVDISERKRLERLLVESSDREQARISQDIHDGLCQQLVGTAYAASMLEEKLRERPAGDCEAEANQAAVVGRMVDEATAQAYGLVGGLFPVRLAEDGLPAALQELAAQLSRRGPVPVTAQCNAPGTITEHEANHLFRIAQEAATNALKHGSPARVSIELIEGEGALTLRVTDDGKGLPDCHPSEGGFGLAFMRYRAAQIRATLDLESHKSGGTVLTCSLRRST